MNSNTTMSVRNPRTGAFDYTLAVSTPEEVAAAAKRLRAGATAWEALGVEGRVTALTQLREALIARREAIVGALIVDTGRVRESHLEFDAAMGGIARWVARAPQLAAEKPPRASVVPPMTLTPASVPMGLVAVISPWNFPLLLALIDAVPALLAGCPVLVKPSEVTPRFIAPFREAIAATPAIQAALEIVAGGPATGAAMIDCADAVCFTGSVPTGRIIARHAAERLIPAYLELGGKDAAIVLADADIHHAARAICWGGLANAGQSCLSVERIFVEAPVYDAFVEALVANVQQLRLNKDDPSVGEIGPLIAARQAETIDAQLKDAIAHGARALTGGAIEHHGGGLWCPPTVLVDVTPEMKIMTDETFGPVLPVMKVHDAEEAISLANGTVFGLSGAVFGAAPKVHDVAKRLECGAISVNDAALTAIVHDGEKQAFKESGLGPTRMGDASITRFRKARVLIENPTRQTNPWWFGFAKP